MASLLKSIGLDAYVERFVAECISGDIMQEIDDNVLNKELGVASKLHRIKLMRLINGKLPRNTYVLVNNWVSSVFSDFQTEYMPNYYHFWCTFITITMSWLNDMRKLWSVHTFSLHSTLHTWADHVRAIGIKFRLVRLHVLVFVQLWARFTDYMPSAF